jgi:hypothetical protein
MELLGVIPGPVVVRKLDRVQESACADGVRVGDERAAVAVLAERQRREAARQSIDEVDPRRAGRREVAVLG